MADGWTDIARRIGLSLMNRKPDDGDLNMEEVALRAEIADFQKMNEIRGRVDADVTKAEAAEALKPWYRQFYKRPTFNDDFLATFNRDNVHLIDVSTSKGVEAITETSVVANGETFDVDCIIYATGFEVMTTAHRRVDFDTTGINQNGLSPNMTAMFDDQAVHVAYIIDELGKRGLDVAEVTSKAEDEWIAQIIGAAGSNGAATAFLESCTPGYYNREGNTSNISRQNSPYAPGINAFNALLKDWRDKGDLAGMDLS